MNLAGLTFAAVANSPNGALTSETRMTFLRDDHFVTASYTGGSIGLGHVVGRRTTAHTLDLLYQCLTLSGELRAGQAVARFSADRMFLQWQWLTGDRSHGRSEWVLQAPPAAYDKS